jgi:geranylgeranyl pyrophosphate synthase
VSYPFGPWNAWFALSARAARMCWEAQAVIWLRGLRIAQGGAKAEAETTRMVAEKAGALAEAQVAMAAVLKGSRSHRVTKKALGAYGKRVRRNRRRLAK